jgi:GntR family transcriptional regulator
MAADTQFQLDREGGEALGIQLTRKLEELVTAGRLKPGEQLPSVRQMATLAGVNINTVRTVYAGLERDGLLVSEHGRGTFVRGERTQTSSPEDREYRRELMRQIAELERQAAYYTRHQIPGGPETPRKRPIGQLLPATELISVRDELLERVEKLRNAEEERLTAIASRKAAVEAEQLAERAEEVRSAARSTRGTASTPPRIVSGPGAWVLKWRT